MRTHSTIDPPTETVALVHADRNGRGRGPVRGVVYGGAFDARQPETAVDPDGYDAPGLMHYVHVIRRGFVPILAAAALSGVAAFAFSLFQTPIYRAQATLELLGVNEDYLEMRSVDPTADTGLYALSYMKTQAEVLRSAAMASNVIDSVDLAANPMFAPRAGLTSRIREMFGFDPLKPRTALERSRKYISENLQVYVPDETRIVEITFDWRDANVAANFTNSLAEHYIDQNLDVRLDATKNTGKWLESQLAELEQQLRDSEDTLQAYARKFGLVFTGAPTEASAEQEKLKQLQLDLLKSQVERITDQARFERMETVSADSLPEVLDDEGLRQDQLALTTLRAQLAQLSQEFKPGYYKVAEVRAQIEALEAGIDEKSKRIVQRIKGEFSAARRREEMLAQANTQQRGVVSREAGNTIRFNMLKRTVESNREIYDNFQKKMKEARVAAAMQANNIRIVSPAEPATQPYKPDLIVNTIGGAFGGLLLGMAFVILRAETDSAIRTPGQSESSLRLPELGVVPLAELPANGVGELNGVSAHRNLPQRISGAETRRIGRRNGDARDARPSLLTWEDPSSAFAGCVRGAATSLLLATPAIKRSRVFMLTSASPRDGKTTVASNLAIAFAERDMRVLLVDADLRAPRLCDVFELANDMGIADLLDPTHPAPPPLNPDFRFDDRLLTDRTLSAPLQIRFERIARAVEGDTEWVTKIVSRFSYHSTLI